MVIHWPASWIAAVRGLKALFAFFSHHHVLGVPLDLPLRFVGLAALMVILRRWLSARSAVIVCAVILFTKELFDIVAVQDLSQPRLPHADDLLDIASGLAGIALGLWLARITQRPLRDPASSTRNSSSAADN